MYGRLQPGDHNHMHNTACGMHNALLCIVSQELLCLPCLKLACLGRRLQEQWSGPGHFKVCRLAAAVRGWMGELHAAFVACRALATNLHFTACLLLRYRTK